jgi:rare lipoprotein A
MAISGIKPIAAASVPGLDSLAAMLSVFCLLPLGFGLSAQAETGSAELRSKKESSTNKTFSGNISWYGPHFNGKPTASGELFDMNKKTAAHRSLAFSSKVMVEDPRTGGTVVVKVNDRGPHVKSRVMDISRAAAATLGTLNRGVCYVDCTVLNE